MKTMKGARKRLENDHKPPCEAVGLQIVKRRARNRRTPQQGAAFSGSISAAC
jgi:hypothetical protein